jgi:para-aminobenzoate synthetase component I
MSANKVIKEPLQAWFRNQGQVFELLEGESTFIQAQDFASWFSTLENFRLDQVPKKPRMIHLMYEAGSLLQGLKPKELEFYAIDSEFKQINFAPFSDGRLKFEALENTDFKIYQKAFNRIQKELHAGNSYQTNLTFPFDYKVDQSKSPQDCLGFLFAPNAGALAQVAFWPRRNFTFLCNTPEVLFTAKHCRDGSWRVASCPIKGTAPSEKWQELQSCQKNQAELLMITDLVRNDLNRLSRGKAQVDTLKARLDVPGLVHQYSEISTRVAGSCSLGEVIRCLFPGGSITGAPKRRTCEIIDDVETSTRGFYCGSTIFWDGSGLTASINIRAATVDWNSYLARLHAGGGITVQSQAEQEWSELQGKLQSLMTAIT